MKQLNPRRRASSDESNPRQAARPKRQFQQRQPSDFRSQPRHQGTAASQHDSETDSPSKRLDDSLNRIWSIAATVIKRSQEQTKPADDVLRDTLRKEEELSPMLGREIARAVFSYYRWFGWLGKTRPLPAVLRQAVEMADAFAMDNASITDDSLIEHCVPGWVSKVLPISVNWLRSIQFDPELWLRARRGSANALADCLGHCRKPPGAVLSDALCYGGATDLFRTPEFHAGKFELQDITSQAVALVCAPEPRETWWDACAGEGGKTLHLSELMENSGLIWASDRASWRLQRLKRRAARARIFNYRSVPWDGGSRPPTKTKFDGVLVDAPCSGIGTWQRNPQARWTTSVNDVIELAAIQKRLLANVAESIKPGGKLIYSVCTMTAAETSEVAAAFAGARNDFEPMSFPNPFVSGEPESSQQFWWPHETKGNGMFVAAWRRR